MPDGSRRSVVHVTLACPRWRRLGAPVRQVRAMVDRVLRHPQLRSKRSVELSVLLTDAAHMQALNHQFRGKDYATNVLSFPADPAAHIPENAKDSEDIYLGDIALGYETVLQEARAQGKDFADHATHLVVHGVLHLLGYDHETPREAKVMESLEIGLLQQLRIANPYIITNPYVPTPGEATHP